MLIKPKNLRETSAPYRRRPNIGPGPGEPETRTAGEKPGWQKRENEREKKKAQMKKNSSLFIHSPAHSRPCSSHFIPPSHRGGSLGPERMKVKKEGEAKKRNCLLNITPVLRTGSILSGEGKGRSQRRKNKEGECIREDSCSLAAINEGPKRHVHPHALHQHTQASTLLLSELQACDTRP